MPKRFLKMPADRGGAGGELVAVRDMSSGKLRIVRPFTRGYKRDAHEPEPDLALLTALSRKQRH